MQIQHTEVVLSAGRSGIVFYLFLLTVFFVTFVTFRVRFGKSVGVKAPLAKVSASRRTLTKKAPNSQIDS